MIRRIFYTFFLLPVLFLALPSTAAADSAKDLLAAGRVDDAISALNGQVSSYPSDAESFNLLCRAYYTLDDWDRAESACKKAVSLGPNVSRYHRWLGRVYGEKANRANFLSAASLAGKVRDEFQRAVDLDQRDTNARIDLAEYFLEAPGIVGGGQDKARAQAKLIGTLDPAMEHWVYARISEKNKDAATAEKEYQQVLTLSKGDAEAWLNMALFLRRQKRYNDMEQAIVKTSQAPTPKREVLVEAAQTLFHAGRAYPFAIELLQRYLTEGPVEEAPAFKAHYLLGTILEKQGDKAGAAREYRASLSLARNFGLAQQALNRIGP
jgi:tetratricopeptide (TPR) repeat protein